MMLAPIPADEQPRLKALRALDILDTAPDERFDRLTRIARRLFGVQTVLVSLVDAHRQWFKSAQGVELRELPRDISFCGHAIMHEELLQIEDARLDPRFADNPLVTGPPHIRFYAGQPLHAPSGHRIGTLCLIDAEPRRLDAEECGLLRDLAAMVEDRLTMVELALLDELTGLCNRRGFELMLTQSLALCRRSQRGAALLYFDLDEFKQINDRLGHAVGDRVLADFATLLQQNFRASDLIGRRGGDEFAVLMLVSHPGEREQALTRLAAAATRYNTEHAQGWRLVYSVGVVDVLPNEAGDDAAALLALADRRMYEDKMGRKKA